MAAYMNTTNYMAIKTKDGGGTPAAIARMHSKPGRDVAYYYSWSSCAAVHLLINSPSSSRSVAFYSRIGHSSEKSRRRHVCEGSFN